MESFYSKVRSVIPEVKDEDDQKKLHQNRPKVTKKPVAEANQIECLYCFDIFSTPEDLAFHKRTEHHATKRYICKWCNIAFTYCGWEYHYKKHTGDQRYSCRSCNKKFFVLQQLQSHLANHKYSCSFCDKSFVTMKQIRCHRKSAHNIDEKYNPYVSKIENKKRKKSNMKTGKPAVPRDAMLEQNPPTNDAYSFIRYSKVPNIETGKPPVPRDATLEQRPPRYDSFIQYSEEPAGKTSGVRKTFVCDKCNSMFPKWNLLRDHIKKHFNCRPYWCNDCNSKFVQKKMLEKHVRQHLYRCQECSKSFSCKNYYDVHCYNEHMQSIDSDRDIKTEPMLRCKYCGSIFMSEEKLRTHIRMTGENLSVCVHCFRIFEEEYEFVCHLKIEHDIDTL